MQVKADRDLGLEGKILLNANCKPQSKHLDVRASYLLRVLSRLNGKTKSKKPGRTKTKKPATVVAAVSIDEISAGNKEYKSKEIIEDDSSSDSDAAKPDKKPVKKARVNILSYRALLQFRD